jgi:hypothetical protein
VDTHPSKVWQVRIHKINYHSFYAPYIYPQGLHIAAAAGTLATAAYLNAKYHIAHDVNMESVAGRSPGTALHIALCIARKRLTTYHILQDQALRKRPNQLFLIFENRTYTYAEFFKCVTRVGNWLINEFGVQKQEIVALDGGNSPEYLMLWFALEGIGAVPSYINNNLTGKSLIHCVKVFKNPVTLYIYNNTFPVQICECRYLLCDRDEISNVQPYEAELLQSGVGPVLVEEKVRLLTSF